MVISLPGAMPAGATAYRILYHSESITGADIAVSGMVVVPAGAPPTGGFPIVSWAHGTTGVAEQCAPSIEGAGSIPYLASLVGARSIVAATDYQGLGTPGPHPYLVGLSEAQGVLDAARAARSLVGRWASNTVLVVGHSQGGQAALFAGQVAQSYAPELFVAGVAAVAPVTSLLEFAPPVRSRVADGRSGYFAMGLYALSATYPDLALASAFTGLAVRDSAVITSRCSAAVGAVYNSVATGRLFRTDWGRDASLRAAIGGNQPGSAPTLAPLLVVQGTGDSLIPYPTTTNFVDRQLCGADGDTVEYVPVPRASHSGVLLAAAPLIVRWISERLHGMPETTSCGRVGTAGAKPGPGG
jgi:pimeloyl-ACP methyl ester carboxylesterase